MGLDITDAALQTFLAGDGKIYEAGHLADVHVIVNTRTETKAAKLILPEARRASGERRG